MVSIFLLLLFLIHLEWKKFYVFQDFCNQLKKHNNKNNFSLKVGNIENQRDFLHVDDVVNADKIKTKGKSEKVILYHLIN